MSPSRRRFDGHHGYDAIYASLPDDVSTMVTPQWLHALRHPAGALLRAIRRNDRTCSEWTPTVPVRIWAAHGDRDVAFANSMTCRAQLAAHGVNSRVVDVGDLDHNDSALASYPEVLRWFGAAGLSLRDSRIAK